MREGDGMSEKGRHRAEDPKVEDGMKAHPYADLFPMMSAAELEALTEDIAANGLRQPVVRYQGLILDGRNRLLACEKAEVEPAFTDHKGDDESALALVISLNVHRRDMTPAQRAMVAAKAWEKFPEQRGRPKKSAESRPNKGLRPRDVLAKTFKVNKDSVQQAKAILAEASDLAEKVATCALSLADAWGELEHRREEEDRRQKEEARRQKDLARIAAYREAVSNGEMTFEQAFEKVLAEEREEKEKQAAQADARREWLKRAVGFVEWVEQFIRPRTDEHLAWYTEPDSPGLFDHGLTADRVAAVSEDLLRAARFAFGDSNGQTKKS